MLTSYAAYLIRCWRDRSGLKRIEIVHVQSGERALAHSTSDALAWIESHGGEDATTHLGLARGGDTRGGDEMQ